MRKCLFKLKHLNTLMLLHLKTLLENPDDDDDDDDVMALMSNTLTTPLCHQLK